MNMTGIRAASFLVVGMITGLSGSPRVAAAPISTAEIIGSVSSPSCMDYQVVGICAWLYCSYTCRVRTSVKVKHYVPDLVVSSYNTTGANPWTDVAPLSQPNVSALGGGAMTPNQVHARKILKFKNVDALGHPGASMFSAFGSAFGYICSSGTTSLVPHFLSTLDIAGWRQALVEMLYPASYVPGMRELGRFGDVWGNIYPRSGFVSQPDDYRAAGLAAQRVADLVTRSGSPHVYNPLTPNSRDGWWVPEPVMEGDKSTHKWQQLSPRMQGSCDIFPVDGASDGSGDYVWALWRPYSCCERRGQTLLYHTGN